MGTEFNWYIVDKTNDLADVIEGQTLEMTKSNLRMYPMKIPLLLLDKDWNAIGYAAVQSQACEEDTNNAKVSYLVVKVLDEVEAPTFTRVIKEIHNK